MINSRFGIHSSEITPEPVYRRRRELLKEMGLAAAALAAGLPATARGVTPLASVKKGGPFSTSESPTSYKDITTYNNFYEFGTGKGDPAENAHRLKITPWSVRIDGEVHKPGTYTLEDILKPHDLEERIYRFRCVEAWSMVIPWIGFPLGNLIKQLEPTSNAKFVSFETKLAPEEMPGQKRSILEWPYREGLRMDEAMHPLTILAVGLYGKTLPNQNGAPIRLVVPWKYGFKSIKSIVRISFTEKQPYTSWSAMTPGEYGFYSNVNPDVDHPRWSQGTERRIGEFLRRKTQPFNGYAEQVANLYRGMDLRKYY